MDKNEQVLAFGKAIAATFSSSDWKHLGLLTGADDWISNHGRLLRSLSFGDDDYEGHVFAAVTHILGIDDRNIKKLLSYAKIETWLQENEPATLARLRGAPPDAVIAQEENGDATSRGQVSYTLGEVIGRGGFGTVYRAKRKTAIAEFDFAVKLFDPSPFVENQKKAEERFRREVRMLQRLQHRAIVPYVDAGIDARGRTYLVMPVVEGVDFREFCGNQDLDACLGLMDEVLAGIEYAHTNGVLHRDLKPGNIRVRKSDNQPVILDFGSAYFLDDADSQSLTTTMVGSLGYIPPEVVADPKFRTPLHDVFACGVILYEVLAGRRPDLSQYAPLTLVNGAYGPLDPIIQSATAAANQRLPSIAEFRGQLSTLRKSR